MQEEKPENMYEKRRKYKRIKINNLAKVNEVCCSLHNVSREGFLLSTDAESIGQQGKDISLKLKINGKWVELKAMIIWSITQKNGHSASVSIGGYITSAPIEYTDFIENLYLEASDK
jgi:hypothetical protein